MHYHPWSKLVSATKPTNVYNILEMLHFWANTGKWKKCSQVSVSLGVKRHRTDGGDDDNHTECDGHKQHYDVLRPVDQRLLRYLILIPIFIIISSSSSRLVRVWCGWWLVSSAATTNSAAGVQRPLNKHTDTENIRWRKIFHIDS